MIGVNRALSPGQDPTRPSPPDASLEPIIGKSARTSPPGLSARHALPSFVAVGRWGEVGVINAGLTPPV